MKPINQSLNRIANRFVKEMKANWLLYLMILPVVLYYFIFRYVPMYGAIIAFKNYSPARGIANSEWVGFKYFIEFFNSPYCGRVIRNTLVLSAYNLVIGFPAPLILALLLNEVKNMKFKKLVQTVSYMPHFVSLIVICSIVLDFTARDGVINQILSYFGISAIPFMRKPEYFPGVYIITEIWQEIGWGSIIYMAALSGISQDLYEACKVDGGGRLRQTISVTLPGIAPTVITMLILKFGRMMNIGYEKIILLYNPSIYETADVISSYVYRKGLLEMNYSYSAAVGLFNSLVNLVLLYIVNYVSRRVSETSLW